MQTYFNSIFNFLTIDIIPLSDWWTMLFKFKNEPLSSNFSAIGFDSSFFLYNMGSLILMMAVPTIMAMISTLLLRINCRNSKVKNFLQKLRDNLVWNGILGSISENYLTFTMCVIINFKAYDGDWCI